MAFSAVPAVVGVPEFGLIHIDPSETAAAFQSYLDTASRLTGVAPEDISTGVVRLPASPGKENLVELLQVGMKLFDAVVWLHAGRPSRFPLRVDPGLSKGDILSMHEVARCVFYCYFMLLTQARYPAPQNATTKPKIPNFLRTIMGMEKPQDYYIESICSFAPQKFDPAWVRYVRFERFGQEVLSRFGLGVAGYRMFGPFGLYNPKSDIDVGLVEPFEFAKAMAKASASWDVHPLTRNPRVLTTRGNLNKNLGNLILDSFTDEQIDEMVKTKVIYAKPEREAGHKNYLQWSSGDDISGAAWIFS